MTWDEVDMPGARRTEMFEAFRRVHLATAAERAVYRLFSSDPDGRWSDAEIASAARLEIEDVRRAVERSADAGIVEIVEEGCWRWRPELRYVFEVDETPPARTDPVCLMPVTDDALWRVEDVFGRIERFCSKRCMAAFLLWPLLFTRHPDRAEHRDRLGGSRAR